MVGQQRARQRRPEFQPPHRAVAAAVAARAARAAPDRELPHQHREFRLEDLRIGEPRVGHVGLHGIAAVEIRSRAGAAGDGLVVLQPRVAECQVVHRALGGREYTQCAVQRIDDALRGLDVARGHGRGRRRDPASSRAG